jgi:hypothetical protein
MRRDATHRPPEFTCECGKIGFNSRADAKRVARMLSRQMLRAYECPYVEDRVVWHLGHLPKATARGEIDRSEVFVRRRIPAEVKTRAEGSTP